MRPSLFRQATLVLALAFSLKPAWPGLAAGAATERREALEKKIQYLSSLPSDVLFAKYASMAIQPQAECDDKPNISEAEVNQKLVSPHACHFYSTISPSVFHGRVRETDQPPTVIVDDSAELLTRCEDLKEMGVQCDSIELAGHGWLSVGLGEILGVNLDRTRREPRYFPADPALFDRIVACLSAIGPKAPLIFSTCGGEWVGEGEQEHLVFYFGKAIAQRLLANRIGHPVISPLGPVSGEGPHSERATCAEGWLLTTPTPETDAYLPGKTTPNSGK